MATAVENVNAWSGTAALLPLFGAFLADSYLGRYRAIIASSFLCILLVLIFHDDVLARSLLTFSATLPVSTSSSDGGKVAYWDARLMLFFFSLYLVAIAQGGHKPFGADQFDTRDPEEQKTTSSFFNWWYFTVGVGLLFTVSVLNYVQDNVGWVLGFGIACIATLFALAVFMIGTWTYQFAIHTDEKGPFSRIGRVFIVALSNWRTTPTPIPSQEEAHGTPLPSE